MIFEGVKNDFIWGTEKFLPLSVHHFLVFDVFSQKIRHNWRTKVNVFFKRIFRISIKSYIENKTNVLILFQKQTNVLILQL